MRNENRRTFVAGLAALATSAVGSRVWADGGSRTGEPISVTGTFAIHSTPDKKQVPLDAIYWLDYRSAKLFATTPEMSKTAGPGQMVSDFSIRDLIADFKLTTEVAPHFLMNAVSLGALGGGTSALIVIETTSKQLGVYWCFARTTGLNSKPQFDLVQMRSYATRGEDHTPVEATSTVGAITIQMTLDKTQVPLDAIYWVESNLNSATLYTALPEVRRTGSSNQMIGDVATRNLGADFKLKPGVAPNFLVSTASLGAPGMGMAALFVMETTTKQLGIYRSSPQATIGGTKPIIELLQMKAYEENLPALPGVAAAK